MAASSGLCSWLCSGTLVLVTLLSVVIAAALVILSCSYHTWVTFSTVNIYHFEFLVELRDISAVPNVRFLVVMLAEMMYVWKYLLARTLANICSVLR